MKKFKAITFSFDDGVQQDKRLIEILNRYSLKCTFNINLGLFDKHTSHEATLFGIKTTFNNHRIPVDEFKQVYEKHEVQLILSTILFLLKYQMTMSYFRCEKMLKI